MPRSPRRRSPRRGLAGPAPAGHTTTSNPRSPIQVARTQPARSAGRTSCGLAVGNGSRPRSAAGSRPKVLVCFSRATTAARASAELWLSPDPSRIERRPRRPSRESPPPAAAAPPRFRNRASCRRRSRRRARAAAASRRAARRLADAHGKPASGTRTSTTQRDGPGRCRPARGRRKRGRAPAAQRPASFRSRLAKHEIFVSRPGRVRPGAEPQRFWGVPRDVWLNHAGLPRRDECLSRKPARVSSAMTPSTFRGCPRIVAEPAEALA